MYEAEVANRTPLLFALSTCPRCNRMKRFLEERGVQAVVVNIDRLERAEKKEHLQFISQMNPTVTFPTLVIGELAVIGEDYAGAKEALGL